MTHDEIVAAISNDLHRTSDDAVTRISRSVNRRYRRVMNTLGLNIFNRVTFELDLEPGSAEQIVDDNNDPVIERIVEMFRQGDPSNNSGGWVPMDELTFEGMKSEVPRTDVATKWAKQRMGATSTTFLINSTIPDGQTVLIIGEEHTSEMSDDDIPAFSEAYHDILTLGGKADELRVMEKYQLAKELEGDEKNPSGFTFFGLLAELKLKTTLMAFGDIRQGKYGSTARKPSNRVPWPPQ